MTNDKPVPTMPQANVNAAEIDKFDASASRWWDPEGEFKPLHEMNPVRLDYITECTGGLSGRRVVDVGCGGGLLAEAMAAQGASVTGVDMAGGALEVARLHALETGVELDYRQTTVEALADEMPGQFDVVTCLEMLEHVPAPWSVVEACARLVRPGGDIIFSTINRNPKAYVFAIVGAEYALGLLPKGTHDYRQFIRPSELAGWARRHGLALMDERGLIYNPLTQQFRLNTDVSVNYLAHYRAGDASRS